MIYEEEGLFACTLFQHKPVAQCTQNVLSVSKTVKKEIAVHVEDSQEPLKPLICLHAVEDSYHLVS